MLIDEPSMLGPQDPVLNALSGITAGTPTSPTRLQQGVYLIGHFNGDYMLPKGLYEDYPELSEATYGDDWIGAYGVCDGVENLLAKLPILQDQERQFVVTLTSIKRENQCPEGGWRWHKWGAYIGAHDPQCEYLYDEKGIDEVFCYHVYEKKTPK